MVKHISTEAGQTNAEHNDGSMRIVLCEILSTTTITLSTRQAAMNRMSSICLGVFLRVVDTVTFVFVVVVAGAAALAAALVDFFAIWPPLFSGTIVAHCGEKWANKLLLGS